MKRPVLVHFLPIMTEEFLSIRASVTLQKYRIDKNFSWQQEPEKNWELGLEIPSLGLPIEAHRLLRRHTFKMLLIGIDQKQCRIYEKIFESDAFGNLNFKISLNRELKDITLLRAYEVSDGSGLEMSLGSFIPTKIKNPKKILICDFDKTLVDTKYSTTREMYHSLTRPLDAFPTVSRSVEIIQGHTGHGYHPFILSSSPHFYENAIRDWLSKNKIATVGIFLKDYRKVFSLFETHLTPKDLKLQGPYKLGQLLDILLMTGPPEELILMGDNYEADPVIYLGLAKLLLGQLPPWETWNLLKKQKAFQANRRQHSQILSKIYQLAGQIKAWKKERAEGIQLKIYIRRKKREGQLQIPPELKLNLALVEFFDEPSQDG